MFANLIVACAIARPSPTDVTAQVVRSKLVLTNNTQEDVFYAVFESESVTHIEWEANCMEENRIPPKQSVQLPARLSSFKPSRKANVYWWHMGEKKAGRDYPSPDKVRVLVVQIK